MTSLHHALRRPARTSIRTFAALAAAAVVGSLLIGAQAPSATATVTVSIDVQTPCPPPYAGHLSDVSGSPADPALVSLGVQCAWAQLAPGKIGQSSGVPITVNGTPAVAFGDEAGYVRAYRLSDGQQLWATSKLAKQIDGPLSVSNDGSKIYVPLVAAAKGQPELAVLSAAAGRKIGQNHKCGATVGCKQLSGVSVTKTGQVLTGGVQQFVYALNGALSRNVWTYLNSDSTNSTAASADLYGLGKPVDIFTDDQTPNKKVGALSGGHLRIFTQSGTQICNANLGPGSMKFPGSFDSSPAIGYFRPPVASSTTVAGTPTIVFGTGQSGYKPNKLLAYDSSCQPVWSKPPTLNGPTIGAPTIADVSNNGDGVPEIIETTFPKSGAVTVYVINGASGAIEASRSLTLPNAIVGHWSTSPYNALTLRRANYACKGQLGTSSQAATFTLDGTEYIVAPAGNCGDVLLTMSGGSLNILGQLADQDIQYCATQNTPVVTVEGTNVGITQAGLTGSGVSCVLHYTIPSRTTAPGGQLAFGPLDWPEFHHDAQLTGTLTPATPVRRDTIITPQSLTPSTAPLYSPNGVYELGWQPGSSTLKLWKYGSVVKTWNVTKLALGTTKLTATGNRSVGYTYKQKKLDPRKHEAIPLVVRSLHLTLTNQGQVLLMSAHSDRWWPDQIFKDLAHPSKQYKIKLR